ncbi:hypothetical protein EVAR_55748_1 [Eumeta japonica]|uniref:Uncharacterized protein n=1 Tax=Eumeta variegata TaxID=151549 RepID=A0A4C1XBB0_EUMVA|nr:hypothetical protein EVAR_55748_1 [Eumeta japonica]
MARNKNSAEKKEGSGSAIPAHYIIAANSERAAVAQKLSTLHSNLEVPRSIPMTVVQFTDEFFNLNEIIPAPCLEVHVKPPVPDAVTASTTMSLSVRNEKIVKIEDRSVIASPAPCPPSPPLPSQPPASPLPLPPQYSLPQS